MSLNPSTLQRGWNVRRAFIWISAPNSLFMYSTALKTVFFCLATSEGAGGWRITFDIRLSVLSMICFCRGSVDLQSIMSFSSKPNMFFSKRKTWATGSTDTLMKMASCLDTWSLQSNFLASRSCLKSSTSSVRTPPLSLAKLSLRTFSMQRFPMKLRTDCLSRDLSASSWRSNFFFLYGSAFSFWSSPSWSASNSLLVLMETRICFRVATNSVCSSLASIWRRRPCP
mmetsp:Transcript_12716/g.21422  ORF Transcript_12716/g.21422 Transcript_12716/m.21422 type:complete len:227 (+) Transcript_12716:382-1062(+)